jgi:hypothetical protein
MNMTTISSSTPKDPKQTQIKKTYPPIEKRDPPPEEPPKKYTIEDLLSFDGFKVIMGIGISYSSE